jgi:hypothetical protein
MDPNQAAKDLCKLSDSILRDEENQSSEAVAMAELFLALNRWLANRGFLPKQWNSR